MRSAEGAFFGPLPGGSHGGWPRGRLIELLPEQPGCGELDLLLPALAEQTRQRRPVMFIAPPLVPCPQALLRAGLDLAHLLVVRDRRHRLWCAEQSLKSGLCGALVVWPDPRDVDERSIRRLLLAAENGDAPLFVCYPPGSQPPPSLARLRLALRPGGEIEILRGGREGAVSRLGMNNVVPLKRSRA